MVKYIKAIEDKELAQIVGNTIDIHFHAAGSGNPTRGNFTPIMCVTGKLFNEGTNICVRTTHGKGSIFFTMFHNSDNINEYEQNTPIIKPTPHCSNLIKANFGTDSI